MFTASQPDCDCDVVAEGCSVPPVPTPAQPLVPLVTSVTTRSNVLSTRGGDPIDIIGTGLGLNSADVNVTYSSHLTQAVGRVYTAQNCTVLSPNTQVRCVSAPGVGQGFQFLYTIDGLPSTSWSQAVVSYAPPVIERCVAGE